ncbi:MAG: hypothetical protein JO011_07890 [Ktedonobacteraceae bacterium]|nr:hypothetical protein [Ktedonobacteraceae bacterium]
MPRIDSLPYSNVQMQGAQRRQWLRQHSPQHLLQSASLVVHALRLREPATSQSSLVLGAGACTEVPLAELCRASDEVVLADLDLTAMQQGRDELPSSALRKQIRLVKCDLSGGVSSDLARLIAQQNWQEHISRSARAVFDAAALCLEQCPVPDPPQMRELPPGDSGLVVSSLVLTQLFSYPLLDVLDALQRIAPSLLNEQERHRRYQDAAQNFRIRVINAHLHLLRTLTDTGGVVVLLTDMRGFVFNVHGTDHDSAHRRTLPLVPRVFPDLVRDAFTIVEEAHWEWLTDLPTKERPGRGYEVVGYVLKT